MSTTSATSPWLVERPPGQRSDLPDMSEVELASVELARGFADISRRLYEHDAVEDVISTILAYAVAGLDGCDYAGLSLVRRGGRIDTPVCTDERARRLDELQYELDEGPCVHAIAYERSFSVPDLRTDERWPAYGPAAADLGAGSMLAYRLFTEKRSIGALNLYAARPNAFTENDEQLALILAAHAAVAIESVRTRIQLAEAIEKRQVIGEAMGMLRERHGLSSKEAFAQLSEASQRMNLKLRELAARIAAAEK